LLFCLFLLLLCSTLFPYTTLFRSIADIATVAMVGALVLIATGCLPLNEALKRIDWNTIIILSAAQAFGAGLTQSGGGQLVADWITGLLGGISEIGRAHV